MQEYPQKSGGWLQLKKTTWILLGVLVIGAFLLLTGHTVHVLSVLPYGLFLLCPLMMFFMMRGGQGDQKSGHDALPKDEPPTGE